MFAQEDELLTFEVGLVLSTFVGAGVKELGAGADHWPQKPGQLGVIATEAIARRPGGPQTNGP
jgi:hypothetical protein